MQTFRVHTRKFFIFVYYLFYTLKHSTSWLLKVVLEMDDDMETSECPFNSSNNTSSNYEQNNRDGSGRPFQNGFISRQFDVLDEISEDKNSGSDNEIDESDYYESEVPDEEIEAMLEEGLSEEFRARKRRKLDNDNSGKIFQQDSDCMTS